MTIEETTKASCECGVCQRACMSRPGFFRREQIEPLAAALGISLEELVKKHLQVDYYSSAKTQYEDIVMLVPRYKGERGGTQVDHDPRGVCHWYRDGKCAIHTTGLKPAECAALHHDATGKHIGGDRDAIVLTWVGQREFVERFATDAIITSDDDGGVFSTIGAILSMSTPLPVCDKPDPYWEEPK